jgi:hypothetical protein
MGDVRINPARIHAIVRGPQGAAFLARVAARVTNGAIVRANRRTGRMANAISFTVTPPIARVGCDVEYAVYVHEGTRPHTIEPSTAQVLHWVGPTGAVYARRVNHPGYGGNPFLRDALVDVIRSL